VDKKIPNTYDPGRTALAALNGFNKEFTERTGIAHYKSHSFSSSEWIQHMTTKHDGAKRTVAQL
jgi:hypothetical protein